MYVAVTNFVIFEQIRLDFDTFVITGPQTSSATVAKLAGKKFNYAGACQTDIFSVSGTTVPPLCDSLSGEHGKFHSCFDFVYVTLKLRYV